MAADLHIHVFEGIAETDLAMFNSGTFGSKWFGSCSGNRSIDCFSRIADTPNVWIGEVSWLKAALSGDEASYIPDAVAKISELIGEDLPVLDDALIGKILAALESPNDTGYGLANQTTVQEFLTQHKGKPVFTVSW